MTDILKAIILGILQGLTEFIPVSSTGHLILLNQFISFDQDFSNKFNVIIQLGSILAVVIHFREMLFPSISEYKLFLKSKTFALWKKTLVGVFPALIIGASFHSFIEKHFLNPFTVATALIIGGIIFILIELRKNTSFKVNSVESLSYTTAFLIGLFQCLAMIPGTSRSGATIVGALLLGCSRIIAVEFSFFLAIPTIFAATVYSVYKMGLSISFNEITLLLVGFVVSFIIAWIVIAALMSFIRKHDFKVFGYYRIVLGFVVLLYFFYF